MLSRIFKKKEKRSSAELKELMNQLDKSRRDLEAARSIFEHMPSGDFTAIDACIYEIKALEAKCSSLQSKIKKEYDTV